MSLSREDVTAMRSMLQDLLRDIAVPKPSRISEHYAALTLSIVLLREQIMPEDTPTGRKIVVEHELKALLQKRAELEQALEGSGS